MDDDLSIDTMLSDRSTTRPKSSTARSGKGSKKVGTKPRVGDKASFTGLNQSQLTNQAYSSTSHFLRQAVGTEKTRAIMMEQAILAKTGSRPVYKSQEEYYDEVIAMKKQIQELNKDNAELKRLIRRKEEEYMKKHKEVEKLLDPSKNDEIRRTLADGKADSSIVLHGLKQKILRLEQQCREKEAAYNKLQSDLKTTKVEEMKIHLETLFNEVIRLKSERAAGPERPARARDLSARGESAQKMKLLMATIRKMSAEKASMKAENKSLRIDLQKCLDARDLPPTKKYRGAADDSTKRDMVATIARLEKQLERKEPVNGEADIRHTEQKTVTGKITLEGTLAQRLDQLDKRETELLKEISRQTTIIKKLKEDRSHYRAKCDTLELELKELRRSGGMKNGGEAVRAEVSPTTRQGVKSPREGLSRRNSRASPVSSSMDEDQRRRIEEFKRNRAAKQIQRGWQHHHRESSDLDDAAELIKSAMMGQRQRQKSIARMRDDVSVSSRRSSPDHLRSSSDHLHRPSADSELDDAADLIKTSFMGLKYRNEILNESRRSTSPLHHRRMSVSDRASDYGDERGLGRSGSRSPRNSIGSGRNSPIGNRSVSSRPHTPKHRDDDDDRESVKSKGRKIF